MSYVPKARAWRDLQNATATSGQADGQASRDLVALKTACLSCVATLVEHAMALEELEAADADAAPKVRGTHDAPCAYWAGPRLFCHGLSVCTRHSTLKH
jgi:hypothetical protein